MGSVSRKGEAGPDENLHMKSHKAWTVRRFFPKKKSCFKNFAHPLSEEENIKK